MIFSKILLGATLMGASAQAVAHPHHRPDRLVDHVLIHQLAAQTDLPKQASEATRESIVCTALTLYHESRGAGLADQIDVSHVVLNRAKSHLWGSSVCATVYAPHPTIGKPGHAFDWTRLPDRTPYDKVAWTHVLALAVHTIAHPNAPDPTHGANFFALPTSHPAWAHHLQPVAHGTHAFYRVPEPMPVEVAQAPSDRPIRVTRPRGFHCLVRHQPRKAR